MKWFRFWTDTLDDVKILQLSDYEYRIWTYLLAIASEVNSMSGECQVNVRSMSLRCRTQVNHFSRALETFQRIGLITINEHGYPVITNWNKRQYKSDNVTDRVKKHREVITKRNVSCNVSETDQITDTDTDTEKDIIPHHHTNESAPCPHEKIISLYHEILPELPVVKIWTPKRQGYLRARWKESPERQSLEWWEKYFKKIKQSPFLTGNVNDFKATLEWVVNQSNMVKIIEGKYDGGNGNGGIRTSRSDPRDRSLQSREDAECAEITARWEAAKKSAPDKAGGNAGNDDAPDFSGITP
jgi:hypothetical protein